VIRAVQKQARTVRVPCHVHDLQLRYKRAEAALRSRSHHEPGRSELAEQLGLLPDEADRLVSTLAPITSLHEPILGAEDLTVEETLADESQCHPGEAIDRRVLERAVRAVLLGLDERERLVLEGRFALDGGEPRTLDAIGRCLGLSRERVRQIETRALTRLRTRWQGSAGATRA
jgi:RNA polymerase primary sigma factor